MADTDILLSVDLNITDAKKTAEQLQKEVQNIFDSRKGRQSAALTSLESQMKQAYNKATQLQEKLKSIGDTPVATEQFNKQLNALVQYEKQYYSLIEKMSQFEEAGGDISSTKYQQWVLDFEKVEQRLGAIHNQIDKMKADGTAFISGTETEEYKKYEQQLDAVNDKLRQQIVRYREIDGTVQDIGSGAQKINMNWSKVGTTIKRINTTINSMFKRVVNHFKSVQKNVSATNFSLKHLVRNILAYGLGIRGLFAVFGKLRGAVSEGLRNYERYDKEFERSVKDLKASLLTLKNALASAFVPIIQVAIPYIKQLIQWLINLASYIGQFTAAIVGQEKYAKAVQQTADALDAAGAAAEGYLSPIDTINKMNKNAGIGFEPAAIAEGISDLAKKFKQLIADLFAPLKKAWNVFGDYVIRAWRRVVDNVKKLVKDIWEDFKDVWTGSTMQQVFYNIVALLGDIGNLVADIMNKIDEAWNANGKRILEALAGHLEIITRHLRKFVLITRQFIDRLDLNPLFEKLAEVFEALQPVAEEVFGILEDFYEDVLLKLAEWTLEEGLPNLLQVFKDFIEKVDWEKLRNNLDELWEHLEPFMERVGEGLILFIEDLSDKIANWVNSKSFEDLLDKIGKFLDGISAEDVKNGIENFLIFVAAIKSLTLIAGLGTTISKLAELYSTLKQISLLKNLTKTVSVGVEADAAGAAAAGTSLGTTFAAAVITAVTFFEIGKKLGEIIFPEDKEYYKNFKWFGENGFFAAVKDWWDMIFLPGIKSWAEQLKNDFDSWTDDVLKIFEDFGDGFSDYISGSINVIVDLLNFDFANAWNNAKKVASDAANAIINTFKDVSNAAESTAVVSSSFSGISRYMSGITRITGGIYFPKFATGGVIPPSADEHLITVGDNNRETEVVSPLSVIRQAVSEAMSAMGGIGNQPVVIKQYLDGKQVAEAVVSAGKLQQMSTGKNIFALG